ncbi:MAG: polysaccharide deacetylase [Bacteroidetes bacterium]|nr:MAG: polysaccharide deacetylase [Bacteroidota bacterium]
MRYLVVFILVSGISNPLFTQDPKYYSNTEFLKKLNKDTAYLELKKKIVSEYENANPGRWGEFVKGVVEKADTQNKYVAFTFDACGGKNGNGYDKELILFLHNEKVPATLFISGKWIDANFTAFLNLSRDTLFEIENHGLNHKPCSINGNSAYGIHGTSTVEEAFDEIEANARKIKALTGKNSRFFRSATTYIDEACADIAVKLGMTAVSFQVLSGDAVSSATDSLIEENVLKNIKPGAIIIMHFNHPEWNTNEAMKKIIPKLRHLGYTFVRLKDSELIRLKPNKPITIR